MPFKSKKPARARAAESMAIEAKARQREELHCQANPDAKDCKADAPVRHKGESGAAPPPKGGASRRKIRSGGAEPTPVDYGPRRKVGKGRGRTWYDPVKLKD